MVHWPKRWYWIVAALLFSLSLSSQMVSLTINPAGPPTEQLLFNRMLQLSIMLETIFAYWYLWTCSYLASGDPHDWSKAAPRRRIRELVAKTWVPAGWLLAAIVAQTLVAPVVNFCRLGTWREYVQWPTHLAEIAALLVLAAVARALSGRMHQRFKYVVEQRNVCFDCGYDLRATPGSRCPECGSIILHRAGSHAH